MATVPVPPNITASEYATSTIAQGWVDGILWALGLTTSSVSGSVRRPLCRATLTSAQSVANATNTAVNLDHEDVDYDSMHEAVIHPSRLTANTTGWYAVTANAQFAANATGVRLAYLTVNGTKRAATQVQHNAAATGVTGVSTSDYVYLNATDYLELVVQQTSTAALNVGDAGLCAEWRSN
ncbi:MAG TPA: hypothetical protein VFB19_18610 [Mycobacterium sp.]|nr:hypothetical protein [Mycobacterium sp.]